MGECVEVELGGGGWVEAVVEMVEAVVVFVWRSR